MFEHIDQDFVGLPPEVLTKIRQAVAEARATGTLGSYHVRTKCKRCGNQVFLPTVPNLTDAQRAAYTELHLIWGHVYTGWAEMCGRCDGSGRPTITGPP